MTGLVHIALWPLLVYWRAYALSVLWGWFVKPATGIATPSIYIIAGVCMTLTLALPYTHDSDSTKPSDRLLVSILLPLIALGFGWVWHWLQLGV